MRVAGADDLAVLADPSGQALAQRVGRLADAVGKAAARRLQYQFVLVTIQDEQGAVLKPEDFGGDVHDPAHQKRRVGDGGQVFADLHQGSLAGAVAVHHQAHGGDIGQGLQQPQVIVGEVVGPEALDVDDAAHTVIAVHERDGDLAAHIVEEGKVVRVGVDVAGDIGLARGGDMGRDAAAALGLAALAVAVDGLADLEAHGAVLVGPALPRRRHQGQFAGVIVGERDKGAVCADGLHGGGVDLPQQGPGVVHPDGAAAEVMNQGEGVGHVPHFTRKRALPPTQ